jgi:hypothetical protein
MDRHATALTSAPQELQTTATPRAANLSSTVGTCLTVGVDVVPVFFEKDIPWAIGDQDAARRGIVEVPPFVEEENGWFFMTENLREEAEADRNVAERKVSRFAGVEDLIRDLRS